MEPRQRGARRGRRRGGRNPRPVVRVRMHSIIRAWKLLNMYVNLSRAWFFLITEPHGDDDDDETPDDYEQDADDEDYTLGRAEAREPQRVRYASGINRPVYTMHD
eukprot:COSAG05_NODE_2735_length_2712_cov_2.337543_3_plen_105_part_00